MWEPDRNPQDNNEFITFIAQVEGLSAVPDGRIYMNAFIDSIEGGLNKCPVSSLIFVPKGDLQLWFRVF